MHTMETRTDETAALIGSNMVDGTAVYGADGERIGSIDRMMIDKASGKVNYAVLSFGGFLGIGNDFYPLPWTSLKYNSELGGYQTNVTERQLKSAPKYSTSDWDWDDRTRSRAINEYYGAPWIGY